MIAIIMRGIVFYPWNNNNTFSEHLFEIFKTYIALIIFIVEDKNRNIGGKTIILREKQERGTGRERKKE